MSDESRNAFCGGLFVGFIFLVLLHLVPGTLMFTANSAVRDCESTLPRNEKCIITAVPATKGGE